MINLHQAAQRNVREDRRWKRQGSMKALMILNEATYGSERVF